MSNSVALLGALQARREDVEAPGRSARLVRASFLGLALLAGLVFCGFYAFAALQLLDAWRSGQWDGFWATAFGILQFWPLLQLLSIYRQWRDAQQIRRGAAIMRRAALAGDERLAPDAGDQPAPLTGLDYPTGTVTIAPLRRAPGARSGASAVIGAILVVFGVLLLLLGGIAAAVLVSTPGGGQPLGPYGIPASVAVAGVGALLVTLGITFVVRRGHARGAITVTADEFGLAWAPAGDNRRPASTPWMAARAFYTLTYATATSALQQHHAYILEADDTLLAWTVRHTASEAERRAAERLSRLIVTRTRLPLRDVTSAANRLAASPGKTVEEWQQARMGEPGVSPLPELAHLSTPERRSRGVGTFGCTATLVVLVLLALLYAGGWGLQRYQPHAYTNLLARAQTQQPLYRDALTVADGDWPEQKATTDNPNTAQFVDGSYHLSGVKDSFAEISGPGVYGDAVIEVTVRHYGTSDNPSAGLALRVDDGVYEMMTFTVNAIDGTWAFEHFHALDDKAEDDWTTLQADEPSDAIHRGDGAANTLAVIVRGGQYLCYVNGHFVGSVEDDSIQPPRGHAGLYVDDGTTTGVFTSIAVYPTPPQGFPI